MYKPFFNISAELLRLVTLATELREWVNSAVVDVSWLPMLQRETAVRLAHSSTAIEGNPLTLPEVEALARGEEPYNLTIFSEIIPFVAFLVSTTILEYSTTFL